MIPIHIPLLISTILENSPLQQRSLIQLSEPAHPVGRAPFPQSPSPAKPTSPLSFLLSISIQGHLDDSLDISRHYFYGWSCRCTIPIEKDAHPPQPEVPESSRSPSVPWPRRKFSSMTMAADSDTISSHRPMTTVSPSIDRASTIVLSTRKSHYQCSLFRKYSNFNFSFAPSMVALPLAIARLLIFR